jgi:acetolactate synthase regulatory subunit
MQPHTGRNKADLEVMLSKEIVKSCMTRSVNHAALVGQLEKLVDVVCLPMCVSEGTGPLW